MQISVLPPASAKIKFRDPKYLTGCINYLFHVKIFQSGKQQQQIIAGSTLSSDVYYILFPIVFQFKLTHKNKRKCSQLKLFKPTLIVLQRHVCGFGLTDLRTC